jgi:uncharacterized protein
MKRGHVPYRMCIVCREMFSKSKLLRLTSSGEGKIVLDENQAMAGKGIYICPKNACLETFLKKKKFKLSFHNKLDEHVMGKLEEFMEL